MARQRAGVGEPDPESFAFALALNVHERPGVVSFRHEGLVRLFLERPDLVVDILRGHLEVSGHVIDEIVEPQPADLTNLDPAPRRADLVVVLGRDPSLAVILEVQLGTDEDKPFTWPAYATDLRARHRTDVLLVVVTPDQDTADWARAPHRIGPGNEFRALVIGPGEVEAVEDIESARRNPELAVLASVMVRGLPNEPPAAHAALVAVAGLEDERQKTYADIIWVSLSDDARPIVEELMRSSGYEYQSEFARKYYGEGKAEGIAEGKAEGQRAMLRHLLEVRFGRLSAEHEARIDAAGLEQLERYAERVLTAESIVAALEA